MKTPLKDNRGRVIEEVVIDESRWNAKRMCGLNQVSALYSGYRHDHCCWGFVAVEAGFDTEDIEEIPYISELYYERDGVEPIIMALVESNRVSRSTIEAILSHVDISAVQTTEEKPELWIATIQDSPDIAYEDKKEAVATLFDHFYGITLTFTGAPSEEID